MKTALPPAGRWRIAEFAVALTASLFGVKSRGRSPSKVAWVLAGGVLLLFVGLGVAAVVTWIHRTP